MCEVCEPLENLEDLFVRYDGMLSFVWCCVVVVKAALFSSYFLCVCVCGDQQLRVCIVLVS